MGVRLVSLPVLQVVIFALVCHARERVEIGADGQRTSEQRRTTLTFVVRDVATAGTVSAPSACGVRVHSTSLPTATTYAARG